jgi:hypothetical protein
MKEDVVRVKDTFNDLDLTIVQEALLVELGLSPEDLDINSASNIAWRTFNSQGGNIELTFLC